MKVLSVFGLTVLLSACATQNQRPTVSQIQANDPSRQCLADARNQIDPILSAKGFAKEPTVESLANRTTATEQDKTAILAYSQKRQQCLELGNLYRIQNYPGPVVMAYEGNIQRGTANLSKLYSGDMTYGEFFAAGVQNTNQLRADLAAFDREMGQAQAQDDAQRRAAAAMILANQPRPQPYMLPMPQQPQKPTYTNCQRFGTQTQCTTY